MKRCLGLSLPIHLSCSAVNAALVEVMKYGGPYSGRDIYPYQLVLFQIDQLRVDGRFEGRDGSVPEGQGILNALLSEAHEMISEMQEESSMLEDAEAEAETSEI